jgi:hypothetical protein
MGCGQGMGQVTGNSRAGIQRTGHNGLWTRDRASDRKQRSRNRENRWVEEIWCKLKLKGKIIGLVQWRQEESKKGERRNETGNNERYIRRDI